ncbi:MAG TPA: GNAT family N-acetyltransferase [Allosphingosinicella sp.]|nr:GNAT family N-acetyltransferase [Allosphingosinicella sp.]
MTALRTARLVLRRARADDLEAMHAILSDPRATTYWSHGPHENLDRTRAWLDSMIDAPPDLSDDFVITLGGRAIGKLGAWRLPEIGFILAPEHWRRGYAAEAMAAFLDHVFARPDVAGLTADVDPRNRASLALLARHGFAETGRAAGTWETHIGRCDSIYFRLDAEDWRSRRKATDRETKAPFQSK